MSFETNRSKVTSLILYISWWKGQNVQGKTLPVEPLPCLTYFFQFQYILLFVFIVQSLCEPPANTYLPPNVGGNGGRPPSPQYGPPGYQPGSPLGPGGASGGNGGQRPSPSYGAPSAPGGNGGAKRPSPSYGAPAPGGFGGPGGAGGNGGRPSGTYGPPGHVGQGPQGPGFGGGPSGPGATGGYGGDDGSQVSKNCLNKI